MPNRDNSEIVRYIAGLDLGPIGQFTGLAIVERRAKDWYDQDPDAQYAVRHLTRFPPGTPYSQMIDVIRRTFVDAKIPDAELIVDQTAVGRSVYEQFWRAELGGGARGLTNTAGHGSDVDDRGGWLVPKKDLVGTMQLLLQDRRIKVADSLEHAATLVSELQQFQIKTVTLSPDALEWRERPHDDLVLAVAIAVWAAENPGRIACWTWV
jgi:hypothetical protein